ncbi:neddylation pathway protein But1 [Schizosaccharomyces japonicus yFS275]|uniref:Neddylation pathway protein But1 n=1 Tax=Schizosaccharomyces japonicus (strain yFS275 / FY16936) TaxID=402676 RepID=B6JXJ9_SCHJY|nr:neddylation pathway protein But1 [Schizosaccharomyces japonicus yFS275]EEB05143.1 neddylation pathway protein But1 [Schizosaccharomyces japonicus yFS275]
MEIDNAAYTVPVQGYAGMECETSVKRRSSVSESSQKRCRRVSNSFAKKELKIRAALLKQDDMMMQESTVFTHIPSPITIVDANCNVSNFSDSYISSASCVLCFFGNVQRPLFSVDEIPPHLLALDYVLPCLMAYNTSIFGITTDSPDSIVAWKQNILPNTISLPIISDWNREICLEMGMLHPLGGGHIALDAIVIVDSQGRRRDTLLIRSSTDINKLVQTVQETLRFLAYENETTA